MATGKKGWFRSVAKLADAPYRIETAGQSNTAPKKKARKALGVNAGDILNLAQRNRLNDKFFQLDAIGKAVDKPADPVYERANDSFGVLNHVMPAFQLYTHAKSGIQNLRAELADEDSDSLAGRLVAYIKKLYTSGIETKDVLDRYFKDVLADGSLNKGNLDTLEWEPPERDAGDNNDTGNDQKTPWIIDYQYVNHLFKAGRLMRKDIRFVETLRKRITQFRHYQQRKLAGLEAQLEDIEAEIPEALNELDVLNRRRLETEADYRVARQLVAENWAGVARQYAKRAKILDAHQGLYFVRARETPVAGNAREILALRHDAPGDLVPGCDNPTGEELPAELDSFVGAVLDIPVSDWRSLASDVTRLPGRERLNRLVAFRQSRLQSRMTQSLPSKSSALALRLHALHGQNQALLQSLAGRAVADAASLVEFQRSAANVLSLQDLLEGAPHRLRGKAVRLREKVDQASQCLLQRLNDVAPSIRLEWARTAEAGELTVDRPEGWPGMDRARNDDFNGIRTVVDLVHWWFRQLSDDPSSSSFTAVGNLIRAMLMAAADDDPQAILHGHLTTLPEQFLPGRALRVALNREAVPGTLLQMVNQNNRMVGVLRVDDQDDEGAVATITRTLVEDSELSAGPLSVIGYSNSGPADF